MTKQQKIWHVNTPLPALQHILARELGISLITAQLLINRGMYTVEQCKTFFNCMLDRLHSPYLMKDMDIAVARITAAIKSREKILVYGDYDADGITAAVLLVQVIKRLGGTVEYYIPDRLTEGYGLHLSALEQCRANGINLIVTVDCGVSAYAASAWAAGQGMDLIVTDHHEPLDRLPEAIAVLNPKRADCAYPFKELAGVGVALKLAQALLDQISDDKHVWQDYLDICCLGTIADVVPLHGENRILVKHGLERLAKTERPGLLALKQSCGIKDTLSVNDVGFRLAPRLNAAGRISKANIATRILLADNYAEAWELANELQAGNIVRQEIGNNVLQEALDMLAEQQQLTTPKVLVLCSRKWHQGVIGIVAARLAERFYRPVLLIALDGEIGKGSARSIPSFNIHQALYHCQEYLMNYGGHALAAGITIRTDRIADFTMAINRYADQSLDIEKMTPYLNLDAIVDLNQLSEDLVNEIDRLQPFGHSNPAPLLGCREMLVRDYRSVGKNAAHLKMSLQSTGKQIDSIGFNLGAYAEVLATAETVDLAFVPEINEYNGRRSLQLKVQDMELSASLKHIGPDILNDTDIIKEDRFYWPELVGELLYSKHSSCHVKMKKNMHNDHLPEIIDRRGSLNRQEILDNWAVDGKPTLVLTNCGSRTIEIAHLLQFSCTSINGQVISCHELLDTETLADRAKKFASGEISVLVATPGVASALSIESEIVVVYHMPYNQAGFEGIIQLAQPKGSVYIYSNEEDLAENKNCLAALTPDKDLLASFYIMLRRKINGKNKLLINPSSTAAWLGGRNRRPVRDFTVHVATQILAELSLLEVHQQGQTLQVHMLPAPANKQDLHKSPIYRLLLWIQEDSIEWMNKFLTRPLKNDLDLDTPVTYGL